MLVAPEARDGPIRYLAAIEGAFTATLEADPGFTGILTKNPAHPQWHILRGPRIGYELNELAEWVDLDRFKPKRGRNVTLFDRLRHWAYRNVLEYKKEGGLGGWNAWLSACNSRALILNGDFAAPLDGREVWWVAKSVAKWTWRRFSLEKRRELIERAHTPEKHAQRGRKGGKKSGEVRRSYVRGETGFCAAHAGSGDVLPSDCQGAESIRKDCLCMVSGLIMGVFTEAYIR